MIKGRYVLAQLKADDPKRAVIIKRLKDTKATVPTNWQQEMTVVGYFKPTGELIRLANG